MGPKCQGSTCHEKAPTPPSQMCLRQMSRWKPQLTVMLTKQEREGLRPPALLESGQEPQPSCLLSGFCTDF